MLRIYRHLNEIGPEARPCAVTIGNFDGVHAAHRRIFRRVAEVAKQNGWHPSVLTFDPHPTRIVAPERAPRLLGTIEERWEMMEAEGLEQVFVLPFSREFAQLTPRQFVEEVLVHRLGVKAVLVGENFRFGNRQAGDTQLLTDLGREFGFTVEIIPGLTVRGKWVSSSEVRRLLEGGEVSLASRMLERPYAISGRIIPGQGIGSRQTVPTLNLDTAAEIIPARGVYITRAHDLDNSRCWPAVTNVGHRPTFNGDYQTIETYLLAPLEGEPPARLRLEFLRRVRDERKFETPELLKEQILRDVRIARSWFRRTDKWCR